MTDDHSLSDPRQYLKSVKLATQKCLKSSTQSHSPISLLSELRHLDSKLTVPPIPELFRPSKEWSSKLIQWFAHIRHQFSSLSSTSISFNLNSILRSIESQEYPKLNDLQSLNDSFDIISYFDRRNSEFSHSDLFWIFGALLFIERIFSPAMSTSVQNIRDLQLRQLQTMAQSDRRVSYLIVIITLIERYFDQ
jgi:hypothetical protein